MIATEGRQRRERQLSQEEILLWRSPEGIPKASRASECNALLSLTRAVCVIAAQRQPGKFGKPAALDWQILVAFWFRSLYTRSDTIGAAKNSTSR